MYVVGGPGELELGNTGLISGVILGGVILGH
jgi:hypothetical protein